MHVFLRPVLLYSSKGNVNDDGSESIQGHGQAPIKLIPRVSEFFFEKEVR